MNNDLHFWVAVFVFGLMGIGLVLTAVEFRRMQQHGDDNGDR
mgnify:FL=1|jgi:intracellular septation protein A